jgi:DNA helicase II / ATP-dependent DNA helicase PcrA
LDFLSILSNKYGIHLNDQQQQAVNHVDGPALVLAGPGSGKTTVITARTAFLIMDRGVNPESILTLTFNRAAKYEMERRFKKIFSASIGDKVHFSTLHSFCNLVVRDYENKQGKRLRRIEGEEENIENKRSILKNIYHRIKESKANDDELEDLISEIGLVKNKMIKDFEDSSFRTKNFSMIYKAYEDYKKSNLLMDFDDMLTFAYGILLKCPDILSRYQSKYRYIQVDEGQDLSKVQFEILKLLVRPDKRNLFIVADDDQSIYGFRGAEPQYIVEIEKQFPECRIFKLENNYRSSRNIVEITSNFIKTNRERYDKDHQTENETSCDPFILQVNNEQEQLKLIIDTLKAHLNGDKLEEVAILYRNNLSSIVIVNALERNGIRFNIKQNKLFFFNHWVVLDILAFLKFALNQKDKDSFLRIYYKMNRFISKVMVEGAIENGIESSIFDNILTCSELKLFQQKGIIETKNEFGQLARMTPLKGLEYIENSFKYFENVKDYCENTGLSFDYLYSFLGILKIIAVDFKTIPLFLQRLEELSQLLESYRSSEHKPSVTLTTTHSSKGLEYDCVLMVDLTEDEFPGKRTLELAKKGDASMLEEERRLFYVGMTRSREYLYLIHPKSRNGLATARSPFIGEVEKCISLKMKNGICEGLLVYHKHFGEGVIEVILEQKNGQAILEIDFKGIRRKLDLDTCVANGLLII